MVQIDNTFIIEQASSCIEYLDITSLKKESELAHSGRSFSLKFLIHSINSSRSEF